MQKVLTMKEIKLIDMLLSLLNENDNNLNLRGIRGYGVGHPVPIKKRPRPVYGEVTLSSDEDDNSNQQQAPIKISRAFLKRGK